jgi:hypothetical protein
MKMHDANGHEIEISDNIRIAAVPKEWVPGMSQSIECVDRDDGQTARFRFPDGGGLTYVRLRMLPAWKVKARPILVPDGPSWRLAW